MAFLSFSLIASTPAHASASGFLSNLLSFFGYASAEEVESNASSTIIRETQASPGIPALDAIQNPEGNELAPENGVFSMVQDSALIAPQNPLGVMKDDYAAGQILIYPVKSGDSASSIAKAFGITINTLLWANDLKNAQTIKPGDKLVILPISGVQVQVKRGDTIDSIAKKYKGNIEELLSINGLAPDAQLVVGSELLIPDGELSLSPAAPSENISRYTYEVRQYPTYAGYYMRPVQGGRKSRGIHGYNGIDLAAPRGTPVVASAQGIVIIARTTGWNGGYGKYIAISHPNGTQTLYAHLQEVDVRVGETVGQGTLIGLLGSTGNSTGPHVHFEIRGAKNPF